MYKLFTTSRIKFAGTVVLLYKIERFYFLSLFSFFLFYLYSPSVTTDGEDKKYKENKNSNTVVTDGGIVFPRLSFGNLENGGFGKRR